LEHEIGETYHAGAVGNQGANGNADHSLVSFGYDCFRKADEVINTDATTSKTNEKRPLNAIFVLDFIIPSIKSHQNATST